ncbi:MAG: hypothetical protein ACJ790_02650 [Myxococcaceae bacterium]
MRTLLASLAVLLVLSSPAFAQKDDDAPIPYPDEQNDDAPVQRKQLPRHSEDTPEVREETEDEQREREQSLAGLDDPNLGLAGEFLAGLMFPDSSRGAFPDARFAWGLRFTWELGRITGNETLRESLFGDVTWSYATIKDGTTAIHGDSNLHYFTVAPAYGLPFGPNKIFSLYAQVGAGLAYQATFITVSQASTGVSGVKPLFQYGVGLRGHPTVLQELPMRVSFRLECTRFRRGYLDDTFAGGSVGVDF